MPISEFWGITPFELNMAVMGYGKRKEMEFKEDLMQAYLISRWVWQKRINIKKFLETEEPSKKKIMTDDEMLAKVKALHKAMEKEARRHGNEE